MIASRQFENRLGPETCSAPQPCTPGIQDHVTECHELVDHTFKFFSELYERLGPVRRSVDSTQPTPTPLIGTPGDSGIAERLCELRQRLINLNNEIHRATNLLDL